MYNIGTITILANLGIWSVELAHILNMISLVLLGVCVFCFWFLYFILSSLFLGLYIDYVFMFFFKHNYAIFLLKNNKKVLVFLESLNPNFEYYTLICLKNALYNGILSYKIFSEIFYNNFIFNWFGMTLNLKHIYEICLEKKNILYIYKQIFF